MLTGLTTTHILPLQFTTESKPTPFTGAQVTTQTQETEQRVVEFYILCSGADSIQFCKVIYVFLEPHILEKLIWDRENKFTISFFFNVRNYLT